MIKPNQWILDDMIKKWENNKSYTLEILKQMPEYQYNYKLNKDEMTFKEHFTHIANGFNFQLNQSVNFTLPKVSGKDKDSYIKSYEILFNKLIDYIKLTDSNSLGDTSKAWFGYTTKLRIFNLMDHHLAHHRAQAIVYLRSKGIKPATYRGW